MHPLGHSRIVSALSQRCVLLTHLDRRVSDFGRGVREYTGGVWLTLEPLSSGLSGPGCHFLLRANHPPESLCQFVNRLDQPIAFDSQPLQNRRQFAWDCRAFVPSHLSPHAVQQRQVLVQREGQQSLVRRPPTARAIPSRRSTHRSRLRSRSIPRRSIRTFPIPRSCRRTPRSVASCD